MKKKILYVLVVGFLACTHQVPIPDRNDPKALHIANLEGIQSNLPPAPYNGLFFIDKQRGYAISRNGALVRTADGGMHWTNILLPVNCHLVALQFTGNKNGYIVGYDASGIRLFSCRDGGLSWVVSSIGGASIVPTGMYFTDKRKGFITAGSRFMKTVDGGSTWSEILQGAKLQFNDVKFRSPALGYAVCNDGVYYSTRDGGDNWQLNNSIRKEHIRKILFSESADYGLIAGNGLLNLSSGIIKDSLPDPVQSVLYLDENRCIGIGQHFEEGFWPIGDILVTNDAWRDYEQKKYKVSEAIEVSAIARISADATMMIGNAPEKSMIIILHH